LIKKSIRSHTQYINFFVKFFLDFFVNKVYYKKTVSKKLIFLKRGKNMKLKNSLSLLTLATILTINISGCAVSPATPAASDHVEAISHDSSNTAPKPYINPGTGGSSSGESKTGTGSAIIVPGDASEADAAYSTAPVPKPAATGAPASIAVGEPYNTTPILQPEYKKLSAGDTDDNAKFEDYLTYLAKYGPTLKDKVDVLKVDISNRFIISVQDQDKKGIPDSIVKVESNGKTIFSGKTYSNGKTLFFPAGVLSSSDCQQQQEDCSVAANYKVTVEKGALKKSGEFNSSTKNWNIELTDQREAIANPNLDITFLIDATGSMGDEISRIQSTISEISAKINAMDIKSKVRYSLVSYKDRSDTYRVKRYDFTSNLPVFKEELDDLSAGGGGDYKESLNEGLYHAIDKVTWTDQDDAVRLVFLIADAPPHLDYSDDIQYKDSMVNAVEKGIKIYPVASSGLDNTGEYIFRQLAQFTFAKFLFITYGGDEQTAGTTPHHVGEFQENNLDSLIVNIVKEELNNLK
jgi:hypothetical protein